MTSLHLLFRVLEPLVQAAGAILIIVLPFWWWTRRFRVDALTRLSLSAIAGFTLLYLLEYGAYLLSLSQGVPLVLFFIVCLVLFLATSRQKQGPNPPSFSWSGILTWFAVASWILAFQSRIVVYGAVTWFGDWYE